MYSVQDDHPTPPKRKTEEEKKNLKTEQTQTSVLKKDRQNAQRVKANKTAADRLVFSQLEICSRSDHFDNVRCHQQFFFYIVNQNSSVFPSTAVIVELSLYVCALF